jgi:hypothetical protein
MSEPTTLLRAQIGIETVIKRVSLAQSVAGAEDKSMYFLRSVDIQTLAKYVMRVFAKNFDTVLDLRIDLSQDRDQWRALVTR